MLKRYRYRAYPTLDQIELFNKIFGCTRVVFNNYIEINKNLNKIIDYNQASEHLTNLKKQPEYVWLNEVPAIALQQSLRDAAQGVSNYFKLRKKNPKSKIRLPVFKKRSNRQSFRIVDKKSYKILPQLNKKWGQIKLPKLSQALKYRIDRALPNEPTSVTIIREPSGEYYISFVVEVKPRTPLPVSPKNIGIDVGLTSLATIVDLEGNVTKIQNPQWYRTSEKRIKKLQKSLSKKQKGSQNYENSRIKLAKEHQRVANRRKDYYRKLSLKLIRENQSITLENLNISGMIINHRLAKSIGDASWHMFKLLLIDRALEYGRKIYFVDQFYPSTNTCSSCGALRANKLKLSKRYWVCEHCGVRHDRDVNAAINILTYSLKSVEFLRQSENSSLKQEQQTTYNFIVTSGREETLTAQLGSNKTQGYSSAHPQVFSA